jgi:hypothetical protein
VDVGAVDEAGVGAPEAPAGVEETESGDIVSMDRLVEPRMENEPLKEGMLMSFIDGL